MEKHEYTIEFKRNHKENWVSMIIKYETLKRAKEVISEIMHIDFLARDYEYNYRIVKNGKQVGNIYRLEK